MGFGEAVSSVLSKSLTWEGRARRSEYWFFTLAAIIVGIVVIAIDFAISTYPVLYLLYVLALIVPGLSVTIRRLHDTNKSGWYWWIGLIPLVGGIIMLVFMCLDSTPGENNYGPSPKEPAAPMTP